MKVVAIIFALAVLSGCHGHVLPQDEGKTSWETSVDQVKDYIINLNSKVDDTVKSIRSSRLNRELDTLLTDIVAELNIYKTDMETKLRPFAEDTAERVGRDLQLLGDKLNAHMIEVRDKSVQYTQEFQTIVEHNANDVMTRVNAYTHKLNKRLSKDTEEMKKKVNTYLEEVYSRAAHRMESVQDRLEPYLNQARERTEEKFAALNQRLKTHVDDVKDKLQTRADNIREKFDTTTENLRTTFDGKMEELRNWYQPYATMIREKLENPTTAL
ncbi:apolipoprotein Eb-like [Osmerus mordax]|uniref:apolipoprotein Eb-like n=1 Tax=Osmerus mordax TaxID=8014 RepID=UPI00350EB098